MNVDILDVRAWMLENDKDEYNPIYIKINLKDFDKRFGLDGKKLNELLEDT